MKVLQSLCLCVVLLLFASGRAVGESSFDLTMEERQQFLDERSRFPRIVLPSLNRDSSAMAWVDSRTLVFSARQTPDGWKAAAAEPSRVMLLNIETMQFEDSGYRGELLCFSPSMRVLLRPGVALVPGLRIDEMVLAGQWGGKLEEVRVPKGSYVAPWSCEFQPYRTQLDANKDVLELSLLPGHGKLRLPSGGDLAVRPVYEPEVVWLNVDGSKRANWPLREAGLLPSSLSYLPWLEAYFWSGSQGGRIYRADRGIEQVPAPPLLLHWSRYRFGSAMAWPARPGVVWAFRARGASWPKQGLYLMEDGRLRRLDDAQPDAFETTALSPDGCKVIYQRTEGNELEKNANRSWVIMNFCGERKQ